MLLKTNIHTALTGSNDLLPEGTPLPRCYDFYVREKLATILRGECKELVWSTAL